MSKTHKVAITGVGAVTPLGPNVDTSFKRLINSESGVSEITKFDISDSNVRIAAQADEFDAREFMDMRTARRNDRFTQMALASAIMAMQQSGDPVFENPDRVGVVIGTGIGGMETFCEGMSVLEQRGAAKVSPLGVPMLMTNAAAGAIAMHFGFKGPSFSVGSACAAGAHAIGEAMRMIRYGLCDVVITGGSEAAITRFALASFAAMGALSKRNDEPTKASRPFDKDRDGFVLGEGSGVLVLERKDLAEKRGARVLAELSGYGATSDAFHVTQPDPEGAGAVAAMRKAINDAGLAPSDVDYINAHGTSTPFNDKIEALAIETVFGDHKPAVSSTKGATGHSLGAAGAVEAVFCVKAITDSVLPPSINLDSPECALDLVSNVARETSPQVVLSNSFGFGGHNASLVITAP